ncbi:MAG TPA: 3-oxoacyl-ACP reductase family protein [Gemmatimonadaceae bacterium]|nr:3-oxoacyl-ACP reductase family protein [Gemmatimonadaceae bacterium]
MYADLKGKVALVTGGARDIGRAIAIKLAECGASVAVNYGSSGEHAKTLVTELERLGGRAVAVRADVTKADDVARLAEETRAALGGRVDVLVNNAGGLVARKKVEEMDDAFFAHVLDLNLGSVFRVTKAVLPLMPDGGAIVNLSSLAAHDGGGPGATAYASAKGGVLTFSRGLAKELAPRKIRVNCVSPGLIGTSFHDTFSKPEGRAATVARTAAGREGRAEDVANAVAFLASDASSYITGESIEINGGLYFV